MDGGREGVTDGQMDGGMEAQRDRGPMDSTDHNKTPNLGCRIINGRSCVMYEYGTYYQ